MKISSQSVQIAIAVVGSIAVAFISAFMFYKSNAERPTIAQEIRYATAWCDTNSTLKMYNQKEFEIICADGQTKNISLKVETHEIFKSADFTADYLAEQTEYLEKLNTALHTARELVGCHRKEQNCVDRLKAEDELIQKNFKSI